MRNTKFTFSMKVIQVLVIITALAVLSGCAGMMAASKFKDEAAAQYVFNYPADELLAQTEDFLSGGAIGIAFTEGASRDALEIDREKLTVAGFWKEEVGSRNRIAARITKVDEGQSKLVMNFEKQRYESGKKDWGTSTFTRASVYELEMIKRLDPQAAKEIEAGAKKAAQEAKKK